MKQCYWLKILRNEAILLIENKVSTEILHFKNSTRQRFELQATKNSS